MSNPLTMSPTNVKSRVSSPLPVMGSGIPFIDQNMKFGITLRYCPGTSPGPYELKNLGLNHPETVVIVEEIAIQLTSHLRNLVWRAEMHRHEFLAQWQGSVAAIDRTPR